jgi:hypothetical protein
MDDAVLIRGVANIHPEANMEGFAGVVLIFADFFVKGMRDNVCQHILYHSASP